MARHALDMDAELLQDADLAADLDVVADLDDLHDDSEEDLLGADWHQTAIRVAHEGLILAGPEQGLSWHIGNQLMTLMGRVGRTDWHPSPDLAIHPTAGPIQLSSFDARVLGVPQVVVEVASERTYRYDIGTKRRAYGRVGVQELLIFDPSQEWLGEAVQAWHATPRGFARWPAGRDGRWQSRVLGISFLPEGPLLRVFDRVGSLMPHISEHGRQLRLQEQRAAEELARQLRVRDQQAADHLRRIAELEAENRRLQARWE